MYIGRREGGPESGSFSRGVLLNRPLPQARWDQSEMSSIHGRRDALAFSSSPVRTDGPGQQREVPVISRQSARVALRPPGSLQDIETRNAVCEREWSATGLPKWDTL